MSPSIPQNEVQKRVIVALDVDSAEEARAIVRELRHGAAAFKIGLQLFTLGGPDLVREISAEHRVFLDLKFHDIPNTVAMAGVEAARLGVWMFNVHAAGGREMIHRTWNEVNSVCEREKRNRPLIIGVTVLTSSDANTLREAGIERETREQVLHLARLAAECGLDGVVAPPLEILAIRGVVADSKFVIVTPGVRFDSATNDDQKRVMRPGQAVSEGSDYLVVGRPVLQAPNRVDALRKINEDIQTAAGKLN